MEDRVTAGLHLELAAIDPADYQRTRVPGLLALPQVERVSWWENVVPGRREFPMAVAEGTLLGVAETDGSRLDLDVPAGTTARTFSRYPRPSQGILTAKPTTGLLVVWISPTTEEMTQPLRDWADFVHLSQIAAAGVPGYTQITAYQNSDGTDPRFMHLYEMDSDDPEATFQAMAETLRVRLGGYRDPRFKHWADITAAGGRIIYVNTFRLLGWSGRPSSSESAPV